MRNDLINKFGFKEIGRYLFDNGDIICQCDVQLSKKSYLVYAFTQGDQILYIGRTNQGYRRPMSYLKNDKMITVRDGIYDLVKEENSVNVLAKEFRDEDLIKWNRLLINPYESVETALINIYSPLWNASKL